MTATFTSSTFQPAPSHGGMGLVTSLNHLQRATIMSLTLDVMTRKFMPLTTPVNSCYGNTIATVCVVLHLQCMLEFYS